MGDVIFSHITMIALGGALGAVARYGLSAAIGTGGVLVANILGCFFMGILVSLLALKFSVPQYVVLFLTVGLLGGFTTFSAFSLEAISLIDTHQYGRAIFYVGLSVFGSFAAFIFGRYVVKTLL